MRILLLISLVLAASGTTTFYGAEKDIVEGQYIVVLEKGEGLEESISRLTADASARNLQALVKRRYRTVLSGFVVKFEDAGKGLELLKSLPGVRYIEQDKLVHKADIAGSWGIDRIDQRSLPLDNDMTINSFGKGVHIYVIDTGINPDHVDFGGRAIPSMDFIDPENGDAIDCNGHGTHCAGTTASNTYGIAREATVYGVRILSCSGFGPVSGSIEALDWLAREGERPAVASMSYSGVYSESEAEAAHVARQMGVVLVAAAGNDNAEACTSTPAASPDVITVGATTITDHRSSFSNYGRCVDIFAPGSGITSLTHNDNNGTWTISGTSMACPHVAGIAAVLLGQGYSSEQVYSKIISSATFGKVMNPNGTPNLLAYLD